jgi:uncharacterized paraquat-inducible protein A
MPLREDEDDDLDDPDAADDESDETVPCPHCRRPVYEDAERCPACGQYLSREDAPRRLAWWLVLGVVAGLLGVLMWCLR